MKSLETLPVSFSDHRRRARLWIEACDDEPTTEIALLATLISQPIVTMSEAAPLAVARDLLVEQRVPAIAVIAPDGALRGLVTRTDVLRGQDDPNATVSDVMSGVVFALPVDSSIECAAALMAIEGVGQVVVTAGDGGLLGMVSALDIARHLAIRAGYLAA